MIRRWLVVCMFYVMVSLDVVFVSLYGGFSHLYLHILIIYFMYFIIFMYLMFKPVCVQC